MSQPSPSLETPSKRPRSQPSKSTTPTTNNKRSRADEDQEEQTQGQKRVRIDDEEPADIGTQWAQELAKLSSDDEDEEDEEDEAAPIGIMTPDGKRRITMRDLARMGQRDRARRRSQAGGTPFRSNMAGGRLARGPLGRSISRAEQPRQDASSYTPVQAEDAENSSPTPDQHSTREDRSAAPEPETPKSKSLFGSLRKFGSATVGRVARGAVSLLSPKKSPRGSPSSSPPPMPQTEGRTRRPVKHVQDIEYPTIASPIENAYNPLGQTISRQAQMEAAAPKESPKFQYQTQVPLDPEEEGLDPDEQKRRNFVKQWRRVPDYRYEYLHNVPREDNPANLEYPMPEPTPYPRDDYDHHHDRLTMIPVHVPLFGADSHMARGTMNPTRHPKLQIKYAGVPLPEIPEQYFGKPWAIIGVSRKEQKRKLDEMQEELKRKQAGEEEEEDAPSTPPRTFMPYDTNAQGDDDVDEAPAGGISAAAVEPSTPEPSAKRRKVTVEDEADTEAASTIVPAPRGILKTPGSVSRARRRVDFTPTNMVRLFTSTPAYGTTPAGTLAPDSMWDYDGNIRMTPESDTSSTYSHSPTTAMNTANNTGVPRSLPRPHPGDVLNERLPNIQFTWHDPNNPDWRPSLANPSPGTFTCDFLDNDEDDMPDEVMENIIVKEKEEYDQGFAARSSGETGFRASSQRYDDGFTQGRLEAETVKTNIPPTPSTSTPAAPKSPRPAHATLPQPSSTNTSTSAFDPAGTGLSSGAFEAANLERKRQEATKTKPKQSSRLSEVTSTVSRSPSPPSEDVPALDATAASSSPSPPDTSPTSPPQSQAPGFSILGAATRTESTPKSTTLAPIQPTWAWTDETNEYICSSSSYPDFGFNEQGELVPSFCLRTPSGSYDDVIVGPDGYTEKSRQHYYMEVKYNDAWAEKEFPFDAPQTYEEAGIGDAEVHALITKNDARAPDMVSKCDARFEEEWNEHLAALESAEAEGKTLVASYVRDDEDDEAL